MFCFVLRPLLIIASHRKILRKNATNLRARIRPTREHARQRTLHAMTGNNSTRDALAEVARDWPQRVPHSRKDTVVYDFRSACSEIFYDIGSLVCTCNDDCDEISIDFFQQIHERKSGPGLCRLPALGFSYGGDRIVRPAEAFGRCQPPNTTRHHGHLPRKRSLTPVPVRPTY